jgi:hypothetical protein
MPLWIGRTRRSMAVSHVRPCIPSQSRSNTTSFQLPRPRLDISDPLFSPAPKRPYQSAWGTALSRRVALPRRDSDLLTVVIISIAARHGHTALTTMAATAHARAVAVAPKQQPACMSSCPSFGMRSQSRLPHSSAYSLRPDHHPQTASVLAPSTSANT